jgi:hypothetical protein
LGEIVVAGLAGSLRAVRRVVTRPRGHVVAIQHACGGVASAWSTSVSSAATAARSSPAAPPNRAVASCIRTGARTCPKRDGQHCRTPTRTSTCGAPGRESSVSSGCSPTATAHARTDTSIALKGDCRPPGQPPWSSHPQSSITSPHRPYDRRANASTGRDPGQLDTPPPASLDTVLLSSERPGGSPTNFGGRPRPERSRTRLQASSSRQLGAPATGRAAVRSGVRSPAARPACA